MGSTYGTMPPVDAIRQPSGTGFAIRDPLPWPVLSGVVRHAESLGYSALLLPESLGRDAMATLTALAGETDRLLLGSGIVPMTSRRTFTTAMGAATVQERSGGRAILGIGTGRPKPGALDELRRQAGELRSLLSGEASDDGHRLALTLPGPVPIWISALGPRAIRLAGEIADGVLLNWCTPQRVTEARRLVAEGAERAGRDPRAVTVAVYIRACLGSEEDAAMAALRAMAAEYASLPAYARALAAMGLGQEAAAAAAARAAGRLGDVPDRLVRDVCLPTEQMGARERLEVYRSAGADLPVVYPVLVPGDHEGSALRTLSSLGPGA
jgi:alkanesulfonate monooxygenase SsuD/methylene tetrahydromethanopterin reductase-like flavin-dependent oxidoreductase (luciferase family)